MNAITEHNIINGDVVRLIGIRQKKEVNDKALVFLQLKTKNQKVFFKYDKKKHDNDNNLLVYLYLKNKTFLNAHLIKNGLVDVDSSYEYKNRDKFLKLQNVILTNG